METIELEIERFTILAQEFCGELIKSVHDAGGDPDVLGSWAERMEDDIRAAFLDPSKREELKRMYRAVSPPSKAPRLHHAI